MWVPGSNCTSAHVEVAMFTLRINLSLNLLGWYYRYLPKAIGTKFPVIPGPSMAQEKRYETI